jgi:hypothetical protein
MDTEVVVVDFRAGGCVQVVAALVPQIVAKAFNARAAMEIAMVVNDDGKPGEIASNYDAAKMLSRMTKRPVVYVDVADNIARHSMRQLGMPASLVKALNP